MKKLVIFFLILMNFSAYADNDLDLNRFSARTYNSLPPVEVASENLERAGNLSAFMEDVSKVLEGDYSELLPKLGVRLIHRHFEAIPGRSIIERCSEWEGKPALITSIENKTDDAVPSSWLKNNQVFERSTDPAVITIFKKIQSNPKPLEIIQTALIRHGLQDILAPSILVRDAAEKFDFSIGSPIEMTYESNGKDRPKSIVSMFDRDLPDGAQLLETSWSFAADTRQTSHCYWVPSYCVWTRGGHVTPRGYHSVHN